MWLRALTGAAALGLYGWRVHDPKGAYAGFFDASDWVTSFLISGDGALGYVKSFVNIILVDQADGFLLGMAFMALVSIVLWPFRVGGAWMARKAGTAIKGKRVPPTPDEDDRPINATHPPTAF